MRTLTRVPVWMWVVATGSAVGAGVAGIYSSGWVEDAPSGGGTTLPAGPEVVLVFFGSESCGYSRLPMTKAAVEEAKRLVAGQAAEAGVRFLAHGVSNDLDPEVGMEFLRRVGRWDENSLGRGWANEMVMRHLFDEAQIGVGTPEVIVLRRNLSYDLGPDSLVVGYHSSGEREIIRLTGAREIRDWISRGDPLDLGPDSVW